jgi:hypothetical protein
MWLCACLELLGEGNLEFLTYGEATDLCAIAIVHFAAELQQQPMTCCVDENLGSFIPYSTLAVQSFDFRSARTAEKQSFAQPACMSSAADRAKSKETCCETAWVPRKLVFMPSGTIGQAPFIRCTPALPMIICLSEADIMKF